MCARVCVEDKKTFITAVTLLQLHGAHWLLLLIKESKGQGSGILAQRSCKCRKKKSIMKERRPGGGWDQTLWISELLYSELIGKVK